MSRSVRYRIVRQIAKGGMAEIFLAVQIGAEGFEKPVVLKRILPAFAADSHFVRMLVDEAHIASSLNHSNLVQVLDLGKSGDQFFLVLEFVDGWSLEQVRRRAQKTRLKLPLPLVLHIVGALCRALAYVHRRTRGGKPLGIVHRDISPQNVLLGREGEVKLADFGIAKAAGRREKSATGIIKGKFAYMSPEQSIGGELDARSDLFSVGTLLYILTTGRKPFDAPTDVDVLMQVRKARYEKPSTFVRDFNPEIERFIARALRADRARRWQSAEQMADRLDAILVKLGQPSGPAVLKRWLETLSARDGVLPPGDMRAAPAEPGVGTIELETSDLEVPDDDLGEIRSPAPRLVPPSLGGGASTYADSLSGLSRLGGGALATSAQLAEPTSIPVPTFTASPAALAVSLPDIDDDADDDEGNMPIYQEVPREPAPGILTNPTVLEGVPVAREPSVEELERLIVATRNTEEEPGEPVRTRVASPATAARIEAALAEAAALGPAPDAGPPRPSLRARLVRTVRRTALTVVVVLAFVGGSAYFGRPYMPPWLVSRVVAPVEGWLKRLPTLLDLDDGRQEAPAGPSSRAP